MLAPHGVPQHTSDLTPASNANGKFSCFFLKYFPTFSKSLTASDKSFLKTILSLLTLTGQNISWKHCFSVKFISILCSYSLQLNFPVSSCLSLCAVHLFYGVRSVSLVAHDYSNIHNGSPNLSKGLWKVTNFWVQTTCLSPQFFPKWASSVRCSQEDSSYLCCALSKCYCPVISCKINILQTLRRISRLLLSIAWILLRAHGCCVYFL